MLMVKPCNKFALQMKVTHEMIQVVVPSYIWTMFSYLLVSDGDL